MLFQGCLCLAVSVQSVAMGVAQQACVSITTRFFVFVTLLVHLPCCLPSSCRTGSCVMLVLLMVALYHVAFHPDTACIPKDL
jgi:hypothetical protein